MDNLQKFKALQTLYETQHEDFMWKVYPYLHNFNISEDIVQDAFVLAFQKLGKYDPTKGTMRTWFNSLLFRTLWDYKRKLKKENAIFSSVCLEDIKAVDGEVLRDHFEGIKNPFHRDLVILKVDYGYSFKEIAAMKKVNPHTVKKVFQRFKQNFVLEE